MNKKERELEIKSILKQTEQEILKQEEKKSTSNLIFDSTDTITPIQLRIKRDEDEKREIILNSGATTSIKEAKDFISAHKQPYKKHFGYEKDYYKRIYELNKWPEGEYKNFVKRPEVASWTMLVYFRFPEGVIGHIRRTNPILFAYVRRYKYFQFLNEEGQKLLDIFIDEFVMMTLGYDTWDTFEFDYCVKYGIKYQPKLF